MASAGGLSRRRVAASSSSQGGDDDDAWGANGSTPTSKHAHSPSLSAASSSQAVNIPTSHAGSAFEGGSKIAYDPRDLINQDEEDAKQGGRAPRLTIMEEVLLLGIKDKQVSQQPHSCTLLFFARWLQRSVSRPLSRGRLERHASPRQ